MLQGLFCSDLHIRGPKKLIHQCSWWEQATTHAVYSSKINIKAVITADNFLKTLPLQ